MSDGINIAIVGATGVVGGSFIQILEESDFPVNQIHLLASSRSAGKSVFYRKKAHEVQDIATFDFSKTQLTFFAAGQKISSQYAAQAVAAGNWVIDNSSYFRYEPDVPLIIPEVNPQVLKGLKNKCIIANPNCSTIQMCVALYPIYKSVGITRINVATYQSVSGTGREAIKELIHQTGELLNGRSIRSKVYLREIAFNVIPHIDAFLSNGYTREEMKLFWETQKIFNDDQILVNATTARVPTVFGHSEAVHLETRDYISAQDAKKLLKKSPGVKVVESKVPYPTAMSDAVGKNEVYVGRIRKDISHPHGLNLWIVADNIRKGAAWNALQIAQLLKDYGLV